MKETPKSISEWSVDVFPSLTEESQEKKLIEELLEYIKAKAEEERVKELSDVYIVASILKERFNNDLGFYAFRSIFTPEMVAVYKAVDDKMEINRSRVWKFIDGVWHHTEKTDE